MDYLPGGPASAMDSASGVDDASGGILRHYTSLVELPAELLVKILEFIPFKEHSNIRLVRNFCFKSHNINHHLLAC